MSPDNKFEAKQVEENRNILEQCTETSYSNNNKLSHNYDNVSQK